LRRQQILRRARQPYLEFCCCLYHLGVAPLLLRMCA
jgi:hypothetical protein